MLCSSSKYAESVFSFAGVKRFPPEEHRRGGTNRCTRFRTHHPSDWFTGLIVMNTNVQPAPGLFLVLMVFHLAAGTAPLHATPALRIDPTHSFVGFKVRHMGIASVTGEFKEYEADIALDPGDLSTLRTTAVIETASIDTDNDRRDNHLRSDDFFNAEEFPEMRFESREVRLTGEGTFELVGDLSIRDTTQEIVLTGEFMGTVPARGEERMAISAEGRLNRFDYGLRWDNLTEAGGLVVGEEVRLVLDVAAESE